LIARLRRMLVILRWGDFRLVGVRARLRFVAVLLVRVGKAGLAAMLTWVLRVIFLPLLSRAVELLRLMNVMRIEGPAVAREVGAGKVWSVVLPVRHGRTMVELLLLLGVALALVFAVILLVVVGRSRLSVERRLVLIVVEAALRLIAIIVLLVEALFVVL